MDGPLLIEVFDATTGQRVAACGPDCYEALTDDPCVCGGRFRGIGRPMALSLSWDELNEARCAASLEPGQFVALTLPTQ